MMFTPDDSIYDENKIEEIELNCPYIITVPSGASQDFMITKLKLSFEHPFWLTASLYPIDNPAKPITFDIQKETFVFAKLFITLTVYKKYPEPHLSQHDIRTIRELVDTAEFHMGTHSSYYIQEVKRIMQNQSN